MPKHQLDNVTIDGFRGLRKLRLDDLGQFNILVGANDSGKTSVLEALSILCKPLDPREWAWMVSRRDVGRLDETRIQSLRWCFAQSGQLADPSAMFEGGCSMSWDGIMSWRKESAPEFQLRVTYKDIVGYPGPLEKDRGLVPEGQEPGEGGISDIQPHRGADITHYLNDQPPITARFWEDEPVRVSPSPSPLYSLQSETLTPYLYQSNNIQVRFLSHLILDPKNPEDSRKGKDLVLGLLQKGLDPEVEDIEVASFGGVRPAVYLRHRRLGRAPLSVFGDGLRRAVLLASVLPKLGLTGILLVDEIDTGIHIRAFQRVFSWLVSAAISLGFQIVATTHSLEAVDAIALAAENQGHLGDLVVFRLEQTEQETRAKRIYGELLLGIRREQGWDVR
jgi:hypothetical protein